MFGPSMQWWAHSEFGRVLYRAAPLCRAEEKHLKLGKKEGVRTERGERTWPLRPRAEVYIWVGTESSGKREEGKAYSYTKQM